MKVAILGGGVSGLSAAHYLKRFAVPVSQVVVFEASSRFGGWIDSKKVEHSNRSFVFEKGPRTLRISTGEIKEINSIQMAMELDMNSEDIDLVSQKHPAALNRYIYMNGQVNRVELKMFGKSNLLSQSITSLVWKEMTTKSRNPLEVTDESIASFVSRRFSPEVAANMADPVMKGICGGDINQLSASSLLKKFYDYEALKGSVIKGVFSKAKYASEVKEGTIYPDLTTLRGDFKGYSVWRVRKGLEELTDRIRASLPSDKFKLLTNERVKSLEFSDTSPTVKVNTERQQYDADIVISSLNSQYLANILPPSYSTLRDQLNSIQNVNMAIVNFFFKKNVLKVQGFGYLVPTKENSPILGCIFDSIFNDPVDDYSVMTVMMGGQWFDQFIGNKSNEEIYQMALGELKKQLNLEENPDYYEVTVLKDAIPQYKVGHEALLGNIASSLKSLKIDDRLHLLGNSFEGIGVNDCIFNARKLVQHKLVKQEQSTFP